MVFFEKYGRMIVVAVAICFVLLFLTPMRNVVGSSINGFVGNFANKVGESLGTVKMPDGSGGATNSEKVKVGDILAIEGTKYIVLEDQGNNQSLVMTASSVGARVFQSNYNKTTGRRPDGRYANTYEGSEIDTYLENEWYNSLPSTMKAAIRTTNIKQVACDSNGNKYETGWYGQVYNVISRHVFLPSVDEIGKIVDLKNPDKVKAFLLKGENIWTRDSDKNSPWDGLFYCGQNGFMYFYDACTSEDTYPAFVIDLSKVDYKTVGHTDYK